MNKSSLYAAYRGSGSPGHPPELMLKIAVFEYLNGRPSPAQWATDAGEHDALKWLGRGITPSRTACYNFRDRMGKFIEPLHESLMHQAQDDGLLQPDTAMLDGSTVRACASRHRLLNRTTLEKRLAELEAALVAVADGLLPEAPRSWMAGTPAGLEAQRGRMLQARDVLDERLAENAKKPKDKRLKEGDVRVSLSDPEAPLGRDKEKVYCPLYTPQFLVEPASLLVVGWDVFAQATDTGTLLPMIDRVQRILRGRLRTILADCAYATLLDLRGCQERSIELIAPVQENSLTDKSRAAGKRLPNNRDQFVWDPHEETYTCPAGHKLDYRGCCQKRRRGDQFVTEHRFHCPAKYCQSCPLASGCLRDPAKGRTLKRLEGQELLDAQREKMKRPEIKAQYKQRGAVIERAFADGKHHRNVRKLHGRGLARAKAEIGLLVLAQNILTLHRLRKQAVNSHECAA